MRPAARQRDRPRGVRRLLRACGASARGFAGAAREEAAFRQELGLALAAIPLGAWLGRSGMERALLIAPVLLVLIVELLNSAIEAAVDRIGLEHHPLSGLAKDCGSAAVLLSLLLLTVVWTLVLLDR
ncbi:MAG: diacylglycerol kinase [Gammaproteobacteria bacterium]|nr:diacylglycerol kinase [Gammaproteobacteria bacterium]